MTRDRTTEQRISAWLVGEGEHELPDRVLAETFHQAAVTRQVRALPAWRIFQMDRKVISFAAGAAAIAALVIAGTACVIVTTLIRLGSVRFGWSLPEQRALGSWRVWRRA